MPSVRSVAIVGAGSAGWLTALSLRTFCPSLQVRLIRPRTGKPIGVGESTQDDFTRLLHASGIDLGEFYRACDATLKCGIYYTDWNAPGTHYWHPFADVPLGPHPLNYGANYTVAHHYQQMILRDPGRFSHGDYYQAVHLSYETCVKRREVSPRAAVAFHVDALELTGFLERKLPGVEVVDTDRVDVRVAEGRIDGLVLDDARMLGADLYVDCTGFSRALIDRVADPTFVDYEANVNRAVAASVPYADPSQATPYTGAHAHEHGWTWAIPLKSRFGSGYVYHGDFCSAEQAEHNFREHWGADRMRDVDVAHIAFDSATLRNPWVQNVVSIGLSAGFVEPLEATGLNWTITSAGLLCRALATRYYDPDVASKFNFNLLGYIRDVHDFIDAHYVLSARRDSAFWRHQTSRPIPPRLQARLDLYAQDMPTSANRIKTTPWAFHEVSWIDLLNGYGFAYAKQELDPAQARAAERALREIASRPRKGAPPLECQPPSRR